MLDQGLTLNSLQKNSVMEIHMDKEKIGFMDYILYGTEA